LWTFSSTEVPRADLSAFGLLLSSYLHFSHLLLCPVPGFQLDSEVRFSTQLFCAVWRACVALETSSAAGDGCGLDIQGCGRLQFLLLGGELYRSLR